MKLRLNRSELAVPGFRTELFEKAAKSNCDVIFLDLEDSVDIKEKKNARSNVIEAINDIDWNNKTLSVRVNAPSTSFFKDDLEQILENANNNLDLLMIPKAENVSDIKKIDKIISFYEKEKKISVGIELIIETTKGLINIENLAKASQRNEALHFGAADLAASMGAKILNIGGVSSDYGTLENKNNTNANRIFYLNDIWHYALFKILITARAFGLRAIDCPFGDFSDNQGFLALAKKSYAMGFDGKMVIHPNQIPLANKIYMPSDKEIHEAKQILEAMNQARTLGKGSIAFNGKLLDIVSIKQAKNVVYITEQLALQEKEND